MAKKNNDFYKIAASPRDAKRLYDAGLSADSADMVWILQDRKPVKLCVKSQDVLDRFDDIRQKGYDIAFTWSLSKMLTILEYPTLEKVFNCGWSCRVTVETRDSKGKFCVVHEGENGPTAAEALANMIIRLLKEGHLNHKYVSV